MSDRQRIGNQATDNYFQAPNSLRMPDGTTYDATIGTAELVNDFRSLTTVPNFSGDLFSLNVSAQLQRRKLYIGLVIDDWAEFSLNGSVNLILNTSTVMTIPIRMSYPPPVQQAPFNLSANTVLSPAIMNPATQWDRIEASNEFDDLPFMPEELIENELRNAFQYDRASDSKVYIYFFRISPLHLHLMCNQVQFRVDRWVGLPSGGGTPNDGVFMAYLACLSQRYGPT